MKLPNVLPLVALVLVSLIGNSAVRAAEREEVASPPVRPAFSGEVPNFALLNLRGEYHELHRTKAGVVVLFFTGNGCPIARQSLPKLRELRRKFADRGVVVWIVNTYAQDDRESIRKEASKYSVGSIPVLLDQTPSAGPELRGAADHRDDRHRCIEMDGLLSRGH